MHNDSLDVWQYSHTFAQELKRPGEMRTLVVVAITGTRMVVEMVTGILFAAARPSPVSSVVSFI